jgi:hypothetical protein
MLQVQMSSPEDIRTVEYVSLPGQDESPVNGSRVFIAAVANSYLIAFGVDDGVYPSTATGEKFLYSLDDSGPAATVAALIKLLESGIIEINGNADFAVRFDALNTALQAMLTSLNADIIAAGGTGSTTLDLSGAKVDEVKLP